MGNGSFARVFCRKKGLKPETSFPISDQFVARFVNDEVPRYTVALYGRRVKMGLFGMKPDKLQLSQIIEIQCVEYSG